MFRAESKGAPAGQLPLYLQSYPAIAASRLFDRRMRRTFQHPDAGFSTPTEYARHYEKLRAAHG